MQEEEDDQDAERTGQGGSEEAPLPSESAHEGGHEDEGKAFADVVGRAEESVERAPDLEREPAGQADDGGRSAHALRPSVHGPADDEGQEQDGISDGAVERTDTEDAHDEIHGDRNDEAGGHEALYVGSVTKESVDELADGVGPVKAGADDTELGGREQASIDERLLHHAHREAADIVQGVAESTRQERLETEVLVGLVHFFGGDLFSGRAAYFEEI